jgi:hypothetical protein
MPRQVVRPASGWASRAFGELLQTGTEQCLTVECPHPVAAALSRTTGNGQPNTVFATDCSLVKPRQNGPCIATFASSRISHVRWNRPTSSPG